MAVGIWNRLDQSARNLLPTAVTLLFMLVSMLPLRIPGLSAVMPPLALICVFYWAIHRPDLLRPIVAFMIGVLHDLLAGTPLGMTALVYTLCYWVLLTQRRFFLSSGFVMMWMGFGLVALGAAFVQWMAYSLILTDALALQPALFQVLVAIAFFPLPGWILMRIHRAFLNEGA